MKTFLKIETHGENCFIYLKYYFDLRYHCGGEKEIKTLKKVEEKKRTRRVNQKEEDGEIKKKAKERAYLKPKTTTKNNNNKN